MTAIISIFSQLKNFGISILVYKTIVVLTFDEVKYHDLSYTHTFIFTKYYQINYFCFQLI
jgi:hypothetical protein